MARFTTDLYDPQAVVNGLPNTGLVLHMCSAEPTSYANVAAVTLGNKADPVLGAAQAMAGGVGFYREIAPVVAGDPGGTTTPTVAVAGAWALVHPATSRVLASNVLLGTDAERTIVPGRPWTVQALRVYAFAPATYTP